MRNFRRNFKLRLNYDVHELENSPFTLELLERLADSTATTTSLVLENRESTSYVYRYLKNTQKHGLVEYSRRSFMILFEYSTPLPEKVREELGFRDDDYVVWFNDYSGRWCIEKVKV